METSGRNNTERYSADEVLDRMEILWGRKFFGEEKLLVGEKLVVGNTREWDTIKTIESMMEDNYKKYTRDDAEILLLHSVHGM